MKTRDEQRALATVHLMAGVGLWCHLRNLVRDIKAGINVQANLQEFQQAVQYAPDEMRLELADELEVANTH